jgi:subtilase family serine protease
MKQGYFILSASIAAALAGAPVLAQPTATSNLVTAAPTTEAPRVTQTINNQLVSPVAKTHLKFVETKAPAKQLADTFKMNHLQLVLKPSAERQAALTSLIADQHNPKSSSFHKWLSPQQFGESYGVNDSDIAAVTSWLKAQGFTVNNVYPNKTQIDFSGTVGQVKAAFHTQENIYNLGKSGGAKEQHIANAGDISVPMALQGVIAGVMGLNDFHPKAMNKPIKGAKWDATKKSLVFSQPAASSKSKSKSQAISIAYPGNNPQGVIRGLVPNDMATMYGVKTIRANGVTGTGVTIAVVEDHDMVPADWTNFTQTFNLAQYGGTFALINPAPSSGTNNCIDPNAAYGYVGDDGEALLDAEWSTAIAPGANIEVATCADYYYQGNNFYYATSNYFGGVFVAATNLINETSGRPDIISASYGDGEQYTDSASKAQFDLMWAQADAEGISVFVSTGDSGSNPHFNGGLINGNGGYTAVDANAFATSPNDTGVGGTDLADILDGTTSKYFAPTPSVVGGSALSYVPEIPWNESCANGVAATSFGYASATAFCNAAMTYALAPPQTPKGIFQYYYYIWETSEAGSGGPSSVDRKPTWQRQVYNAAPDQSRDLPDVALFAGSFGDDTFVAVCSQNYVCTPDFTPGVYVAPGTPAQQNPSGVGLSGGTSLASPMFAGIQALIDQGLAARGLPLDQGNAAPTLYALAGSEYGTAGNPNSASLTSCNANNGATGTSGCVFHNVTSGSISSACYSETGTGEFATNSFTTPNCYFYNTFLVAGTAGSANTLTVNIGLTTTNANPTSYSASNKAFPAQPGWSFASGLGSVNVTNLLMAWRAFVGAPPAPPAPPAP